MGGVKMEGAAPLAMPVCQTTPRLTPSDMNGASPHKWEYDCGDPMEEHLGMEARSFNVICSKKKSSSKLRIAMGQSCSEAFRSDVWTALALFITLTRAKLLNWEASSCLKATCIGLG